MDLGSIAAAVLVHASHVGNLNDVLPNTGVTQMTNPNTKFTAEKLADAILKASGSGLRHYTMPLTRDAIVEAATPIVQQRDELLAAAKRLVALDDDPHPGLFTWCEFRSKAGDDLRAAIANANSEAA
jgi:hypothetical protein